MKSEINSGILKTLFVLWAGHFLIDMMLGFWSVYKTLAHLDIAIMGMIAGICPFLGEGMQMVFGPLGDKGYRKVLFAFGLAAGAFNAFIPYTNDYAILFILYFTSCLGSGAFHPTAAAIASSLTTDRKALCVTVFASGGAFGMGLSHMIFSSWYLGIGSNTAYFIIPSVLLIAYILFFSLHKSFSAIVHSDKNHGMRDIVKLFQSRDLTNLYIFQVCNQAICWGLIFLLPDILVAKGYDSWICFGGGHMCYILGGAFMMIPSGYISDKYSERSVLITSTIFGGILFYLFLYSTNLHPIGLLALLFALGSTLTVSTPVAVAFGNKMMPSRPGLVSAFLMGLVWCVSEGIGTGGGGLLSTFFTHNAPIHAMAIVGMCFIVSLACAFLLPQKIAKTFEIEYV